MEDKIILSQYCAVEIRPHQDWLQMLSFLTLEVIYIIYTKTGNNKVQIKQEPDCEGLSLPAYS